MIEYIICKNCMHNLARNDIFSIFGDDSMIRKKCLFDTLCSQVGREINYYSCCSDQGGHAKDETCDMWRAHNMDDYKAHIVNDCPTYNDFMNHRDGCNDCQKCIK